MTVLTIAEVADRLRISKPSTYRLIEAGRLEAVQVGERSLRVTESALQAFLEGNVKVAVA